MNDNDILDDPFHGCAWAAFIELAQTHGTPPDSETHRRLTYAMYEQRESERELTG